jgi:hypothetical protein
MRQIPITNKPNLFALVDDNDFELVSQYKWYALKTGCNTTTYYAYANYSDNGKKTTISMHTLLINPERQKGLQVDHCPDHNGLNNCRSNLILCSPKEHTQRHSALKSNKRKDINMAPKVSTGMRQRGLCLPDQTMEWAREMANHRHLSVSAFLRLLIDDRYQTFQQDQAFEQAAAQNRTKYHVSA